MTKRERSALVATVAVVFFSAGLAFAGSQGGVKVGNMSLFALAVGLIFVLQWIAFVPAFMGQTERFYDLMGSLTYISVSALVLFLSPVRDGRSLLLFLLIFIWAGRLGSFLFLRIRRDGKDGRFDAIKPSFFRFLFVWTLQGAWVAFTASAALIAMTTETRKELDVFALIGGLLWIVGFAIEVVADQQKSQFRADPANKGKFIQTGLWARSRHPNYFGEILLWIGVTVIALPILQGWQWIGLISPIFVTLLLTRVSGIPLLEQRADAKWGGQAAYEEYKEQTPILILRL